MSLSNPSKWDNTAAEYERMPLDGPLSIPCTRMLDVVNSILPFSTASTVLDIGCGPGTLPTLLFKKYGEHIPETSKLIATDFSAGMVEAAKMRKEKEMHSEDKYAAKCWARLELDIMDAQNLDKVATSSVSHVMGSLVYFMLPEYKKGLSEARRVLTDDGVFACTSWAKVGWMGFVVQAAQTVTQKTIPSPMKFAEIWKSPEGIKGELESAGFQDVHAEFVDVNWHVPEPKEFVKTFMKSSNPGLTMILKDLTEEQVALCSDEWVRLVEENGNICHGQAVLGVGRK